MTGFFASLRMIFEIAPWENPARFFLPQPINDEPVTLRPPIRDFVL
jgi:hypothetical protein